MSLTPLNRWETFMAKIAGKDVDISPLNRREHFYEDIAKKSASVPAMEIEDPTDGQTLVYDADDDVWKNAAAPSEGGLVVTVTEDTSGENPVYTMDKTWKEISDAAASGLVMCVYASSEGETNYSFIYEVGHDELVGYWANPFASGGFPNGDDGYIAATETDYPSCENSGVS